TLISMWREFLLPNTAFPSGLQPSLTHTTPTVPNYRIAGKNAGTACQVLERRLNIYMTFWILGHQRATIIWPGKYVPFSVLLVKNGSVSIFPRCVKDT